MISKTIQKKARTPEAMQLLGQYIGATVSTATILALTGDLGCGKTAFVQGLAKGLDVPDAYYVTSPTFMLINRYPGRLPLYHIDLYRIEDPTELDDIGLTEILHKNAVVAVEWAERLGESLPLEHLAVSFSFEPDDSRNLIITGYGRCNVRLITQLSGLMRMRNK